MQNVSIWLIKNTSFVNIIIKNIFNDCYPAKIFKFVIDNFQFMPEIVILGSGNVASHFAKALKNAEINIKQIFGRNIETVSELAKT